MGRRAQTFQLPRWAGRTIFAASLGLVFATYLALKMFAMHAYVGDEHIYLYQAKLVTEGFEPYVDFAMAHPPLHTLFAASVFKLFGYQFFLGRLIPVFWCATAGMLLALLVRRELGAVASVVATALFLLAYEPLRASSHATGVNMTVAMLLGAVLVYRTGAIRTAAALCAAAVFTRLYASPGVLTLAAFALIANRQNGVRLITWGAVFGIAGSIALGVWTDFQDMLHHMIQYHAKKTPMAPGKLATMRNTVLFHNADIAILFCLAQIAWIASLGRTVVTTDPRAKLLDRLRTSIQKSRLSLVILASAISTFSLAVLLSMDRVWMYYFVPSFPFAAIAGGWLVSRWGEVGLMAIRNRIGKQRVDQNRIHGKQVLGWAVLFAVFVIAWALSPMIEHSLPYYARIMDKPPAARVSTYKWRSSPLPDWLNDPLKTLFWKDERTIGNTYHRFNYLLWHESRVFNILEDMVETINAHTTPQGEIFGDSGTVPLLALLSGNPIAGNEVDTNIQRYRSQNASPKELLRRIDSPKTEMIILRSRFGVAGVPEIQRLVSKKYTRLRTFRSDQHRIFSIYKRREENKKRSDM
ncbi:MAG: hypothetical protein QNJ97_15570 [Myxococcota bacterium]|nr:hypothetical protein [Myxococcota bacterium]